MTVETLTSVADYRRNLNHLIIVSLVQSTPPTRFYLESQFNELALLMPRDSLEFLICVSLVQSTPPTRFYLVPQFNELALLMPRDSLEFLIFGVQFIYCINQITTNAITEFGMYRLARFTECIFFSIGQFGNRGCACSNDL